MYRNVSRSAPAGILMARTLAGGHLGAGTFFLVLWLVVGLAPWLGAATFNVRDYGAVPDDGKPDTAAVVAALTAAQAAGGGTVLFPKGPLRWARWNCRRPRGLALRKVHIKGAGREARWSNPIG